MYFALSGLYGTVPEQTPGFLLISVVQFALSFSSKCKKKMSQTQNFLPVFGFVPAVLKKYKSGWVVVYWVTNPASGRLTKKCIKVNGIVRRFAKKSEAVSYINVMIDKLNRNLYAGWNPFNEIKTDPRMGVRLSDVTNIYLNSRKKELRPRTYESYASMLSLLTRWCNEHYPGLTASKFTMSHAVRYTDYLYDVRDVCNTTYNNTLKVLRVFWNWMLERCYTENNPFLQIKSKKKMPKIRTIIPAETRRTITDYLIEKDKRGFLLVCKLIYGSLLRPNEIRHLRIKDINLSGHYILVPDTVAKNHKQRFATITPDIIELFQTMNLERFPADWYVFGSHLSPAATRMSSARLVKNWAKLRKDLKLPEEMQLYSFRDTGIFEMLKSGIDDLTVMQHADHSSLDITTIYANHFDPGLIDKMYNNCPRF